MKKDDARQRLRLLDGLIVFFGRISLYLSCIYMYVVLLKIIENDVYAYCNEKSDTVLLLNFVGIWNNFLKMVVKEKVCGFETISNYFQLLLTKL